MPLAIQKLARQSRAERREIARAAFKRQFIPPAQPVPKHRP